MSVEDFNELVVAKRNRKLSEELAETKAELERLRSVVVPTSIAPIGHAYCPHLSVIADEKMRTLSCSSCKKIMDPFDLVAEFARKERNINFSRKEQSELNADIARLTKIRNSLRSAIKRKGGTP